MKLIFTIILALVPVVLSAVNRSVSITDPGTVYAGQAFYITTSASTDATDSEQIGFYHGQYSYDNGASWNWFTSDVNAGKSATRNAWINTGVAYSQILIMVKIAFRGGGAGDVDYNGNAIDWGGSWGSNQSPPAKLLTITVQPPPNQPPTIAWVQPNATSTSNAYVNQWTPVQAKATDPDGNLTSTFVWREWIPHAFNGGGNGYECYSDANGYTRQTPGTVQFQAKAVDSDSAESSVIYHTITYINRDPSVSYQFLNSSKNPLALDVNGNAQASVNQTIYLRVSGNDPDGALAALFAYVNIPAGTQWHYEQAAVSGGVASYDFGPYNPTVLGTYNAWANAQDSSGGTYTWQGNGWSGSDAPDLVVTNTAPSVSYQFLDASKNPLSLNVSGNAIVALNQAFYVRVTGADPDGALAGLYIRFQTPSAQNWNFQDVAVSGATAIHDFGPFTPTEAGTYDTWASVQDTSAGAYQWQGDGWWGEQAPDLVVTNSAPTISTFTADQTTVHFGDTISVSFTVNDPEGNMDFTNLWVHSPARGWRTILADNSVVTGGDLIRANAATSNGATGGFTRTYQVTSADGFGPYVFALAAVDAVGARSDATNITVTNATDPNADDDGDGFSNGQELEMGTRADSTPTSGADLGLKVNRPN